MGWSLQKKGNRARGEVREAGKGQTNGRLCKWDKEFGFNSKGNRSHWRVLSRGVICSNLHLKKNILDAVTRVNYRKEEGSKETS